MSTTNAQVTNVRITDEEYAWCHGIIHTASVASAAVGGGLAQRFRWRIPLPLLQFK